MISINLLPKKLRRSSEPAYWRLVAVLIPLLVIGIAGFMQFSANQTEARLQDDVALKRLRLASLQADVNEQRELQARQQELNELIAIANTLRDQRIIWSDELFAMLETLPPSDGGRPRVAFSQLVMQPLSESERQQRVQGNVYDGAEPLAEMTVQGTAISTQALADYIASLQRSPLFGVAFNSASRQSDTELYQFSMTIGALTTGRATANGDAATNTADDTANDPLDETAANGDDPAQEGP
jgi:type IV pilus assembly protein PilN